jgi:flagellar biosynthesis protein FlhF
MEIQRILARDTRTATDQAMSMYGRDVLIISNQRVNGQIELLVAVDIRPTDELDNVVTLDAEFVNKSDHPTATQAKPLNSFEAAFEETMMQRQRARLRGKAASPASTAKSLQHVSVAPVVNLAAQAAPVPTAMVQTQHSTAPRREPEVDTTALQAHREAARGREIVDMVRDEIAALRREFALSQRMSPWQDTLPISPVIKPLINALSEAGVPTGLRGLLIDRIREAADVDDAMAALRSHLVEALPNVGVSMPENGQHIVTGPTGVGKTLMAARLAHAAALQHGSHAVAMISFADSRPGAWSQIQMLASQAGIDCYRAVDANALSLLLDELSQRAAVIIDTAGIEFERNVEQIKHLAPKALAHVVMAADSSSVTIKRIRHAYAWDSVMVSKLDEASQPWPLLQALIDSPLPMSLMSPSSRLSETALPYSGVRIVEQALAHLPVSQDNAFSASNPTMAADSMAANILKMRAPHEKAIHG